MTLVRSPCSSSVADAVLRTGRGPPPARAGRAPWGHDGKRPSALAVGELAGAATASIIIVAVVVAYITIETRPQSPGAPTMTQRPRRRSCQPHEQQLRARRRECQLRRT